MVVEPDWRVLGSERDPSGLVAVAVEVQVEPRARADLAHAEGKSGVARSDEEAADQGAAAGRLVRLQRMAQGREHLGRVAVELLAQQRPRPVGIAVAPDRWIMRGE
jgi:hypothetical protein